MCFSFLQLLQVAVFTLILCCLLTPEVLKIGFCGWRASISSLGLVGTWDSKFILVGFVSFGDFEFVVVFEIMLELILDLLVRRVLDSSFPR